MPCPAYSYITTHGTASIERIRLSRIFIYPEAALMTRLILRPVHVASRILWFTEYGNICFVRRSVEFCFEADTRNLLLCQIINVQFHYNEHNWFQNLWNVRQRFQHCFLRSVRTQSRSCIRLHHWTWPTIQWEAVTLLLICMAQNQPRMYDMHWVSGAAVMSFKFSL